MNPIPVILSQVLRKYFKRHMVLDRSIGTWPQAESNRQYFLYAHVPFCEYLCSFCPFHRVKFQEEKARKYFSSLNRELEIYTEKGIVFSDLYVGGGTPTVLVDDLCRFINKVRQYHPINNISVETNPNHLSPLTVDKLLACGVKRLSVGVQSLDNAVLHEIGRIEPYGNRDQIVGWLSEVKGKFNTLNVDLICNFPSQSVDSVISDLDLLVTNGVDQITVYPLMPTVSGNGDLTNCLSSTFHNREAAYYQAIYEYLLPAYNASTAWCFSRDLSAIDEYIVEYDQYLGIGSGAFSYISGVFYSNTFSLNHYNKMISNGYSGITASRLISQKEQAQYDFLVKLFSGKLEKRDLVTRYGDNYTKMLANDILFFKLIGALSETETAFYLTDSGRYYWIVMMKEFLVGVNIFRDAMRKKIREELSVSPSQFASYDGCVR